MTPINKPMIEPMIVPTIEINSVTPAPRTNMGQKLETIFTTHSKDIFTLLIKGFHARFMAKTTHRLHIKYSRYKNHYSAAG
jgi:hypothetical protein